MHRLGLSSSVSYKSHCSVFSSAMSSQKRSADHLDSSISGQNHKVMKSTYSDMCNVSTITSQMLVFPIFAKQPVAGTVNPGTFRWINPPIGPKKSCLHGIHLEPNATPKVAAFDLDGCLIESTFKSGKKVKSDSDISFTWWRRVVPKRLKQVHEDG